jgi:hypothetical protein
VECEVRPFSSVIDDLQISGLRLCSRFRLGLFGPARDHLWPSLFDGPCFRFMRRATFGHGLIDHIRNQQAPTQDAGAAGWRSVDRNSVRFGFDLSLADRFSRTA